MILLVFIVASDTVVLTITHIDELSGVVNFCPLPITTKDGAKQNRLFAEVLISPIQN